MSVSRKTAAWAAAAVLAVAGSGQPAGHQDSAVAHPAPLPPLRVAAVSPADGDQGVDDVGNITVTYNQPLPASAPLVTVEA